jgi:vacuolar-type H+-ATPase subunit F/Vma7
MKEFILSYRQTIITHLIAFFLGFLLLGCGTRTKTKTESESEINAIEKAKEETENRKLDSIRLVVETELRNEFEQRTKEIEEEEGKIITTIETTEKVLNPNDFRSTSNPDKFINDATGLIIERTTKKVIEENWKKSKEREAEIREIYEEKRISDSIALHNSFESRYNEKVNKLSVKEENKTLDVKKTGLSIWWKIGIGLFILIIVLAWIFRKWLLIQFPWLAIFKRKKRE